MESVIVFVSLIVSVILGGITVTYLKQSNKTNIIKLLLAFSGGFLLSIAFTHFIPDLYHEQSSSIGVYILLGFLIQLILEFFSGGIEHGHVHVHKGQNMPWGLFISLSAHSILEGIPLGHQLAGHEIVSSHSHGHDNSLLLGIVLHQIPVAIALMTLLINTNISTLKAWLILIAFALMTPLGTAFGLFYHGAHELFNFSIILAVVVGMFLHISTTIIFETSENHKFNLLKLGSIVAGVALAFFVK
ncbi:MAG: ZIP family metal transporter [Bacteroidota bacterium]